MVTISVNNIHDRWRVDRGRDVRHNVRCVCCVCVVCSIDFSNVAKIGEDLNKGVRTPYASIFNVAEIGVVNVAEIGGGVRERAVNLACRPPGRGGAMAAATWSR